MNFLLENRGKLVGVLCAGVALFLAVVGWKMWHDGVEQKAAAAYFEAKGEKEKLAQVVAEFGRSDIARFALADLAKLEEEAKNWEGCKTTLETLYRKTSGEPFFRVLALHGMGVCARGAGDTAGAVGYFERAAKEPGHVDPFASRFEVGRSFELAGDPQALSFYQKLLEENPTPEWRERLEQRILWLELQAKR